MQRRFNKCCPFTLFLFSRVVMYVSVQCCLFCSPQVMNYISITLGSQHPAINVMEALDVEISHTYDNVMRAILIMKFLVPSHCGQNMTS